MRSSRPLSTVVFGIAAFVFPGCGGEGDAGSGGPARPLGEEPVEALDRGFEDPHGNAHQGSRVFSGDVVLVVTAPILSQRDVQQGLTDALVPRSADERFRVVFVQDMDQALIGSIARSAMRDRWSAGDEPLLLLDDEGLVRQAFGVPEGETVVFALRDRVVLERFEASRVLDDPGSPGRSFER